MPLISKTAILEGDRLALSRLLTQIENRNPAGEKILDALFPHTGQAFIIGITGAPGTGKSTLVNHLAGHFRERKGSAPAPQVAVVAVDPSSPFSGGAVLGDRVRMRDLSGDPGVFIRSMASRGSLGGLAETTSGFVGALDAAGFKIILIETVGAGQGEVEIARLAHSTVVIEAPGMGDDIQSIKAGILEIADILVVNKADKPEAEITRRVLTQMLRNARSMRQEAAPQGVDPPSPDGGAGSQDTWQVPILMTAAIHGEGLAALKDALLLHQEHLQTTGELAHREQARLRHELNQRLQAALVSQWRASIPPDHYQKTLRDLVSRKISPGQAVRHLITISKP